MKKERGRANLKVTLIVEKSKTWDVPTFTSYFIISYSYLAFYYPVPCSAFSSVIGTPSDQ